MDSTERANIPMPSYIKHLTAVLVLLPVVAWGTETNWQDIESRIQYGYYTEDARSLGGVMELLAPAEKPDAIRSYYAGLANYRLTQLVAASDKGRAKSAAEACVSSLDQAIAGRKDFADALALQSICLDRLSSLEAWRTPFAESKSGSQIEKARHLASSNPRVLLLDGVEQYERQKSTPAQRDHALSVLKAAAAAFEEERKDTAHIPGWGSAEVYVYLAKCYLDRGATLEARDALERALLLAPEFTEARRLMAKFTSG
jgi:tetratricopeptide (TPR) repeat protein